MQRLAQKLKHFITGEPQPVAFKKLTTRDLIRMESKIGSQLFGPVPKGHRREFFCLDETAWIWYEEWIDPTTKKKQSITTRYEIHPTGILKVQDGQPYQTVEGEELKNIITAIELYYEQVVRHVYHHDPATSQPLYPQPATIKR
ncbi:MAG TPA: hypothetical protein VFT87_03955 [Candidatus Saccharimonadales bacterium]|nr:hypothetical protein [Candidatus Saccharimonadales bacterium]